LRPFSVLAFLSKEKKISFSTVMQENIRTRRGKLQVLLTAQRD